MGGHAPPLGALLSSLHVDEDDAAPALRPAHAALLAQALRDATLSRDWPRATGTRGSRALRPDAAPSSSLRR